MLRKEVLSFLVVGGLSFFVDIAGFNILLLLGCSPLFSSFVGTSLAIFLNFVGNYKVTFSHKGLKSRRRTVLIYTIVALSTLFLNQILMALGILVIGNTNVFELNLLRGAVILAVMCIRFVAFKYWVFI